MPPAAPFAPAAALQPRFDRLGVWASVLCAIHCLAAPILFLALPSIAGIWAHPASHAVIALLVLPLAATVVVRGYRAHRRTWVLVAALIGVVCVLVGCALPFVLSAETLEAASLAFGGGGGGEAAAAAGGDDAACAACCAQVTQDADGGWEWRLPPASIATVLGSSFLVACHLGNLVCMRACCAPGIKG